MDEVITSPKPHAIELQGVPENIKIEQTSTRRDGTVELGETFARDSIDFSGALGHLNIHTEGAVAGSQFNGEVFESPEAVAAKVQGVLPEALQYDQYGRAELTVTAEGTKVGYSGVKPISALEGVEGVKLTRSVRIPGGEAAEVDGTRGAWYPEMVRNPETGRFEVATNPDGSVKNPHGKFEPEANVAEVDEAILGEASATDKLTLIVQKNPANGQPTVLTIFPGENAPAFPARIQSEAFQVDTLTNSPEASYWNEHAFIKPRQAAVTPEANVSKPETDNKVGKTLELMQLPAFREGFIETQTTTEREASEQIVAEAKAEASKLARAEIEQAAAAQLGTTIEQAKRLGKDWGHAMRVVGGAISETTEGKTLQEHLFAKHLAAIQDTDDYRHRSGEAADRLQAAQVEAVAAVDALLKELGEAQADPSFLDAVKVWGNTPDKDGELGDDGQGYNAGLIHFFQYRADKGKSSRFKAMDEPCSVDGFKQFSAKLAADIRAVGSDSTDNIEAILQDTEGNQRVYILRPDGELLVAFQRPGDTEPKISSVMVRKEAKDFDKQVETSLSGKDKGVLNKLGSEVHRIL